MVSVLDTLTFNILIVSFLKYQETIYKNYRAKMLNIFRASETFGDIRVKISIYKN